MVVDASVWVSALMAAEVHHGTSRSWMAQHLPYGNGLVVPTLLLVELAGAVTRRTGLAELAQRSVDRILMAPGIRLVSLDTELGREASRLASQLRLRGADAVYVATARALHVPLATWDMELASRAQSVIETMMPS